MKLQKLLQQYYQLQHRQKETLQASLIILSLLTLLFCNNISGYFANYDSEYWFDYFIITERFSMLLIVLVAQKLLKERCWLGYELLLAFLLQDFVDRVILDIQVFNINDVVSIGIIGIQLIVKIYVRFKK